MDQLFDEKEKWNRGFDPACPATMKEAIDYSVFF
uniref:Uncharacterized protein n=1 Tax=Arundo donax TaxID=35708 RepID=A0A0A9EJ87_ARUDO